MILRVLPDAEAEIDAARRYLNGQSFGLGSQFLDELETALTAVAARPLSFPKLETLPIPSRIGGHCSKDSDML